jgi:hypothetical protein
MLRRDGGHDRRMQQRLPGIEEVVVRLSEPDANE